MPSYQEAWCQRFIGLEEPPVLTTKSQDFSLGPLGFGGSLLKQSPSSIRYETDLVHYNYNNKI